MRHLATMQVLPLPLIPAPACAGTGSSGDRGGSFCTTSPLSLPGIAVRRTACFRTPMTRQSMSSAAKTAVLLCLAHLITDARVKPAHDAECGARANLRRFLIHLSNSHFAVRRAKLRRPVSLRRRVRRLLRLPSGCEGMARQGALPLIGSISASPCEDAEAPPGAPPGQSYVRAHLRPSSSASPNVGSGTAAPGRALRFRAFGLPLLPHVRRPLVSSH